MWVSRTYNRFLNYYALSRYIPNLKIFAQHMMRYQSLLLFFERVYYVCTYCQINCLAETNSREITNYKLSCTRLTLPLRSVSSPLLISDIPLSSQIVFRSEQKQRQNWASRSFGHYRFGAYVCQPTSLLVARICQVQTKSPASRMHWPPLR